MGVNRKEQAREDTVLEGRLSRVLYRGDDQRFAVGLLDGDDLEETLKIAGELGQLEEGIPSESSAITGQTQNSGVSSK